MPDSRKPHPRLGEQYLAQGLTGLSRAHEVGWFQGHYGAAVIAAYFFCHENGLDEPTTAAVRAQVDAMIAKHAHLFEAQPHQPSDPALIETIPEALARNITKRNHGVRSTFYIFGPYRNVRSVAAMRAPKRLSRTRRLATWRTMSPTADRPTPSHRSPTARGCGDRRPRQAQPPGGPSGLLPTRRPSSPSPRI